MTMEISEVRGPAEQKKTPDAGRHTSEMWRSCTMGDLALMDAEGLVAVLTSASFDDGHTTCLLYYYIIQSPDPPKNIFAIAPI